MEKTPPSNDRHEASFSREFLPTGGFACFLALYWGGIPRKEVGQRGSNPGVECGEIPLFRGWNVEKNFACKDVAYELFTFSVFHFFSQMGSLALCQQLDAHKQAVLPTCCTLSNYGWGKCRPAIS
jgi:hypothetical protein